MAINASSRPALPSLRSRLLIAAAVWLLGTTLAAGYLVPSFIKSYLVEQEKQQLYLYLDELTALTEVNSSGQLLTPSPLSNPRFQQPYSGLYWTMKNHETELRSRSLWDTRITGNTKKGFKGPNKQSLLVVERQFRLPEADEPIELVIAANQDRLLETLQKLTHSLWFILAMSAGGTLLLIWLQVSWSLLPLKGLQKKLKLVRDGELSELTGTYPAEIRPVVDDLNALLFHYQELLERARQHAGNLSHALKTPIAVLNNEVANLPIDERRKLSPSLQQLQQHIDYHLGRARMAGAANILAAKTAPSPRVDAISMAMDKVYAHRGVVLVNELDSELMVAVEKRDLDEIIGNVIENGYKWAHGLIRVHHRDENAQTLCIIVEDDGPGIDDDGYESVLKRGVRLDETTPGTGLGLNIVHELTHSYRGKLTLSRSSLGGLKVELLLPKPRQ
ncbi:ATP-binding protein [Photobacterium aphoticum]|uniref:histidine kinase n=1 Tax=Photobacterium aphoticum TaxID=754436 RepID=A0A090QKB1_9GAMM|nr:ATP-binding protein [Photobacterium aphoticum]KLV01847.1 histidine kinase [Photobacterium aphoticum]PSU60077.1 ATP-binding protein [Photobacterium aphoticum]GAL02698.1 signal transduction histidine kinase [Photobacterium aphoticum]GHA33006.1 sensor histidine kinase [Photobacterium aphoticum]